MLTFDIEQLGKQLGEIDGRLATLIEMSVAMQRPMNPFDKVRLAAFINHTARARDHVLQAAGKLKDPLLLPGMAAVERALQAPTIEAAIDELRQ